MLGLYGVSWMLLSQSENFFNCYLANQHNWKILIFSLYFETPLNCFASTSSTILIRPHEMDLLHPALIRICHPPHDCWNWSSTMKQVSAIIISTHRLCSAISSIHIQRHFFQSSHWVLYINLPSIYFWPAVACSSLSSTSSSRWMISILT